MPKRCCDKKNIDVNNEKSAVNVVMPNRIDNKNTPETSAYDSHCKSCGGSSYTVCNQKYDYRKYRLPRPMKHYRMSYSNGGNTKISGKPTIAAFDRPGGVITNGLCNGSKCNDSYPNSSGSSSSDAVLYHTKSAGDSKNRGTISSDQMSDCCTGCESKVCAGQVILKYKKKCDCMDYDGSKTKGRHITRSANTRVNVRKGLSNRERLRQRGLTYAQNQNGYNDTTNVNKITRRNQNSEMCSCSNEISSVNPYATVYPSNSKHLTDKNPDDKGFYTQGAVDAGTRMEKLKLQTFNKLNKKRGNKNDKNRNVIYRGDNKSNQNSKKFSINKRFYMGNRVKSCCE